jgi:hypothetical protein
MLPLWRGLADIVKEWPAATMRLFSMEPAFNVQVPRSVPSPCDQDNRIKDPVGRIETAGRSGNIQNELESPSGTPTHLNA